MPRPSLKTLTPPEWKVMNIVWNKKTCSARDVYLLAGELYGWGPNTVRTYLKGLVNRTISVHVFSGGRGEWPKLVKLILPGLVRPRREIR